MIAARALLLATALGTAVPARAGDAARGEAVFQYCYSCHSVVAGETNTQGPNLRGIIGRPIAAEPGFDYSPALRALAARERVWTADLIARYVADPRALVPKTAMEFPGLDDAGEREDLLAYLGSAGAAAP